MVRGQGGVSVIGGLRLACALVSPNCVPTFVFGLDWAGLGFVRLKTLVGKLKKNV